MVHSAQTRWQPCGRRTAVVAGFCYRRCCCCCCCLLLLAAAAVVVDRLSVSLSLRRKTNRIRRYPAPGRVHRRQRGRQTLKSRTVRAGRKYTGVHLKSGRLKLTRKHRGTGISTMYLGIILYMCTRYSCTGTHLILYMYMYLVHVHLYSSMLM